MIEIIIRWLRIQPEDLFEGDKLSPVLTTFVKELNQHGYQTWSQELQSTCEKVSKKVESYQELCKSRELYCLDTLVEEAAPARDSNIMDIDTEDLAKYVAALVSIHCNPVNLAIGLFVALGSNSFSRCIGESDGEGLESPFYR